MSSEKEQIKNTINEVQEVVDLFYQQNDKDAFDKFLIVLEDMTKAIDNLAIYKNTNPGFVMDDKKIFDKVLLADILQYDFIEYIESLVEKME